MKAIITAKSELSWPGLTRHYTFDIAEDDGVILLGSQSVESRPSEIQARLGEIVSEYQAAFEDANDLEVGAEV